MILSRRAKTLSVGDSQLPPIDGIGLINFKKCIHVILTLPDRKHERVSVRMFAFQKFQLICCIFLPLPTF